MARSAFLVTALFMWLFSYGQSYRTQPVSDDIYTIEVNLNGAWNLSPVMKMNGGDYIHIGFDQMFDDNIGRLRYRIIHCDANWKQSGGISEIDYLDGFNDNLIEDYTPSMNTTVEYIHYNLKIPNKDINLKLSGNYVVEVYDEDDQDATLMTACFSVIEPEVTIGCSVSTNTDIDSNKEHQQLSLTINHAYNLRDPLSELKVFALQNNRLDTERSVLRPSFIGGNKLVYEHVRDLIFEAGNEYRRFEIASYRYNGLNVAHIEYDKPYYWMYLATDKARTRRSYSYDQDQNGRFVLNNKVVNDIEREGDYFITYFSLESDELISDDVYVNGSFTYNTFDNRYKMKYDDKSKKYILSLVLKQGLYNYVYLTKGGNVISTSKTEGNYSETENEYTILVYYRPVGKRYDALVGTTTIHSRGK